ncbi:hypothetical protein BKA70DRAFT_684103 [Coprinopsis sp. MPI-PUGE-AT-0042]|nr:hypothetical protein BKA70DRAFT_684103 [Coprinopsis sp. MPI-PUGE-AT-0042]
MELPRMPAELEPISWSILRGEWKAEHLKTALRYLQLKDVPKSLKDPEDLQRGHNAFAAVGIITRAMQYCDRYPAAKDQTFGLLLEQMEGVLAWLNCVARLPWPMASASSQLQSAAQLVQILAEQNEVAHERILSSERAVDVIMTTWTTRLEGKKNTFGAAWPDTCCVSNLLRKFLADQEGCPRVLARICSTKTLWTDFWDAMAFRMRQVREMRTSGTDLRVVKNQFSILVDCYDRLGAVPRAQVASRPTLRCIVDNLIKLQHDYTKEEIFQLLRVGRIAERVVHPNCLPSLVSTGIIPLIASMIKKSSHLRLPKDQAEIWARTAINALRQACCFPRSLHALVTELDPFRNLTKASSSSFGTNSVEGAWNTLLSTCVFNMLPLLEIDQGPLTICDNIEHSSKLKKPSPKTCSGCRMVVYCSPACQKHDWETRHHRECRELRQVYLKRSLEGLHYTYKIREFQTRLATEIFRDNFLDIEEMRKERQPSHPPQDLLTIMECTSDEGQARYFWPLLQDYFCGSLQLGDSPALEERAKDIYGRFLATKNPKSRLLEGMIRWNRREVMLFLELEPFVSTSRGRPPTSWKAVRSVVRIR